MGDDVYVVISEDWTGKRSGRCVLAGDEVDAQRAHEANFPDEHVVCVKGRPR